MRSPWVCESLDPFPRRNSRSVLWDFQHQFDYGFCAARDRILGEKERTSSLQPEGTRAPRRLKSTVYDFALAFPAFPNASKQPF